DPASPFARHFVNGSSEQAGGPVANLRERGIIEDVETASALEGTKSRELALAEDIHAMQLTPMMTRAGKMVGVLSTQFRQPHRPADHDLKLMDLLARTAAAFVREYTKGRQAEATSVRLAVIVESSDDAIISKDLNGTMLTWNAGARRLFGYTAEEAVGEPVTLLMPPERVHE